MQDFFLYWQRVFLHYFIDIFKVWVLLAPLVIFYKEIQYEAHCFTAFLLHVQMLNSNVKYSWFALIVKISKKLQSCGVEEQVPEPFVTQKDSHQAKPSFWPGQQLECTVKIPYVHTHTHTHAQLFYMGYEKQLPCDRKPTGQYVLQHTFICLSTMKAPHSSGRAETSFKLQTEIKYAQWAKSNNFYQLGKSNYANRSLHSRGSGEKNRAH